MNTYTQPALFPDTDLVGPGRPKPWPTDELDAISDDVIITQADELPFDEEQS
ncbi:hypothetical protein [Streptomyces niveus]|uniref:hypothetical protein n=1 Tax=Streptomyces niveus TaxID=193462 RepID=UPI00386BB471